MACSGLQDPRLPSQGHRALMSSLLSEPGSQCSTTIAALRAKAQAHPVPMALLVLDGTNGKANPVTEHPAAASTEARPPRAEASQRRHRMVKRGASLSSLHSSHDPHAQGHTDRLAGEAVCRWLNDSCARNMGLQEDSDLQALAAMNDSINNNLTVQRHVVGYAKSMVLHKQQPFCFWLPFFPLSGAKQVDKLCLWACELQDTDGTCSGQPGSTCRAILLSSEVDCSRDVQLEVLIGQHLAYQYAPCMVTVLNMAGSIVSQNGESAVWLGCHTLEHNWPVEECGQEGESLIRGRHNVCISDGEGRLSHESGRSVCSDLEVQQQQRQQHRNTAAHLQCSSICRNYFHALFYEQELLDKNETFLEDMLIRSPLLRKWLGATEDAELWHRVHVIRLLDPLTQQMQYCLIQVDVTKRVLAERQVLQLQQQQRALLTEILPPQVLEHLLMVKTKGTGGSHCLRSIQPNNMGGTAIKPAELSPKQGQSELDRVADSCAADFVGSVKGGQESDPSNPDDAVTRSPTPLQLPHHESPPSSTPSSTRQPKPHSSHQHTPHPSTLNKHTQPPPQQSTLLPSPIQTPPSTPMDPAPPLERIASLDQAGRIHLTPQDVHDLATYHEEVTVLFADIKGFTSMVNHLHPSQVMLFLDTLYSTWDALVDPYGVYKVETIGDCFMAASGLFCTNTATGNKCLGGHDPMHAQTMLDFAKAMLESSMNIKTPLGETVQVRVGIHCGPCSSGVVGKRMPRWCLFGDVVNTANRMESNGVPGCIHASYAALDLLPEEDWIPTGGIFAKGKGIMHTGLLPVLPGAHRAAQLHIAQRAAPSTATSLTSEVASLCLGLHERGPPSRSTTNLSCDSSCCLGDPHPGVSPSKAALQATLLHHHESQQHHH